MASSTDICNLALKLLKSGLEISNVDTEQTTTAKTCRAFYAIKRDELLAWRPWGFNKTTAQLVEVDTNPTPVWAFSYQVPTNCAFVRRILGVTVNFVGSLDFQTPTSSALVEVGSLYAPFTDNPQTAVAFEVVGDLIYTNQPNAQAEYSMLAVPEGSWPPKFVLAMAYAMAGVLAPTLMDGDMMGAGQRCEATSNRLLNEMAAAELNQRYRPPPLAEWNQPSL